MEKYSIEKSVMDTGDHSKNGASTKSQMSNRNLFFRRPEK